MASDVKFRRINGHIVPIKQSHGTGAKEIAAGLAVGAAAGIQAAKHSRSAAKEFNAARNAHAAIKTMPRNTPTRLKQFKVAAKTVFSHQLEGMRQDKANLRTKRVGAIVGASLVGAGVHKALSHTGLSETQKAAASTASGIGANVAIRSAYDHAFQAKGVNVETGQRVGKSVFKAVRRGLARVAVRGFKL